MRSWLLGGALLAASALMFAISSGTLDSGPRTIATSLTVGLTLAATIVLGCGVPGGGSVTAGRPLGTAALIGLGVIAVAQQIAGSLLTGDVSTVRVLGVVLNVLLVVQIAFGLIAVTAIARAGVVPRPWQWAPAIALGTALLPTLIGLILGVASPTSILYAAPWLSLVAAILQTGSVSFLGLLAVSLGSSPVPRPNSRPASTPVPRP